MTPQEFISKWSASELKERSASQSHFNDLCALLGEKTPTDADPKGEWFCFERGAKKTGGGNGWADVWKRGCFGWEYKGPTQRDLNPAYEQLLRYAVALENPPLLVVSDCRDIYIHTNFTNTVQETHVIPLEEIGDPENLRKLKWLFTEPERLKPDQTREAVTEQVAKAFASVAQRLREAGHEAHTVAHFVNRLLFCMFAEDIGLLPEKLFTQMVENCEHHPERFAPMATELFAKMNKGGFFGRDEIAWFNGGLFDDDTALPMDKESIKQTLIAARMDWSAIEPSIFGTMFERGLDPAKRSQLGAHYTDAEKIMMIVEPVILDPLNAEWAHAQTQIQNALDKAQGGKSKSARTKAMKAAQSLLAAFLNRLRHVRVLDPACGSGNFLYLALMNLKDLEHRVLLEAEAMGMGLQMPQLGPEAVKGIELNPYAAELARVTVWIGQIQWMIQHGFSANRRPILQTLDTIENRDALINLDGSESIWPEAEFIVGNPPFVGGSKMRRELGDEYTENLRSLYHGRVPGGADLVTYWFEKGRAHLDAKLVSRCGFVTTQSIRMGSNQKVLAKIINDVPIFAAWSDEPWVVEGAAVRVSLVCFGHSTGKASLDGQEVDTIYANLVGGINSTVSSSVSTPLVETVLPSFDLTRARLLIENKAVGFEGTKKYGAFDIPRELAESWLHLPNPNGKPNSDVLKPWANGRDITSRPSGTWIIDFGTSMSESDAALFEAPFAYVLEHVRPKRKDKKWWLHERPRPELRAALTGLSRFIATARVAKHRFFVWLPISVLPDTRLNAIARSDDTIFGVLSSRIHEVWSLANASMHGVGNDPTYNAKSCFETFPFPEGLTPDIAAADYADDVQAVRIAEAAKRLDELRNNWLNPPEWVDRVPEVVAGYPDRIIAKPGHEADLKKRTLTNLYNARPAWLDHIHKELDAAVAAAYGWDDYTPEMPDEEILSRLFALNQERSVE